MVNNLCAKCKIEKKTSGFLFCPRCMDDWMRYASSHKSKIVGNDLLDDFINETTKEKVEFN